VSVMLAYVVDSDHWGLHLSVEEIVVLSLIIIQLIARW